MNTPVKTCQFDIETLKKGDESAWVVFFNHFNRDIFSIAAWPKWHFEAHTREDVIQTIRLGIVGSIGRLQSEQSLRAFVRKICVNRCIDMLRRQIREQGRLRPLGRMNSDGEWEDVDLAADDSFDPVHALMQSERARHVREALNRLEPPCRQIILQFYSEHLSYREIAVVEGMSINTVGSRLSRCLDKLKALLENTDLSS